MAKVRFVPNRAGIGMMLKSDEIGAYIESIARSRAEDSMVVTRVVGRTRQNIRVLDPARDALAREAESGHLTRILGREGV